MAKCPVCNSRKAKRKCLITEAGNICSLCCGETRKEETCHACVYYQPPRRKYNEVPAYTPMQMDADPELQDYSYAIEGALCAFDRKTGGKIKDAIAISIIERLIDKYHYQDSDIVFASAVIEEGFHYVDTVIQKDLEDVPQAILIKILGVIYFVAKRRDQGGRDYLTVISRYVGERLDTGIRILSKH